MYALVQWSFDRGLLEYVNTRELKRQSIVADSLADYYRKNGNLESLRQSPRVWQQLMQNNRLEDDTSSRAGRTPEASRERRPPPPREFGSNDQHRPPPPRQERPPHRPPEGNDHEPRRPPPDDALILLDANKDSIFGRYNAEDNTPLLPIVVNEQTVGWLTLPPRKKLEDSYDLSFLQQQQTSLIVISALMVLLSSLIALPLSLRLIRPIKKIANASHKLASGQYETRVVHESSDELGQLTHDFNALAQTLQQNESARKRWIADISHELRTPLAITRGELEAMLDGIRPMNAHQVGSAHKEVMHLQALVEDLYQLTNADIGALTYQKSELDFTEIVEDVCSGFETIAGTAQLKLETHIPDEPLYVSGDKTRLHQLIQNLLNNSIKYTDAGGRLQLKLAMWEGYATLTLDDSKPGVPDEALPQLFDHLFRVESSRNRQTGGSGLGLAICKKIVEGHGGELSAEHSPLGGLRVIIRLPIFT